MKKLIVLFLLVAFLLTLIGLIGCDDSPTDPDKDAYLEITYSWDTPGDLDLELYESDQSFASSSQNGTTAVHAGDCASNTCEERVFVEEGTVPPGTYSYYVNVYYRGPGPVPPQTATLAVETHTTSTTLVCSIPGLSAGVYSPASDSIATISFPDGTITNNRPDICTISEPGQSNEFSGTFFREYEKVSSVEWGPTGEEMGTSTDFFQETFALVQNGTSLSGNFTRSHSWTYTGKPHTSEGPQPGTITKSCCTAESTVPVSGTVQGNSAEISWEKKLGQGCTGAEGCTCPIFHTACTCVLTLDNGGDVLQFDCQCAETFYDEGTSRNYEATRQ